MKIQLQWEYLAQFIWWQTFCDLWPLIFDIRLPIIEAINQDENNNDVCLFFVTFVNNIFDSLPQFNGPFSVNNICCRQHENKQ